MYKLENLYFMIQRGCSDDLFIRYFDEEYNCITNPLNNLGCVWLPITKEHADFLKAVSEEVY